MRNSTAPNDLETSRLEHSINRLYIVLYFLSLALLTALVIVGGPVAVWMGVIYAVLLGLTGIGFATTAHLKTKKLEDQNMALVQALKALRYDFEQARISR